MPVCLYICWLEFVLFFGCFFFFLWKSLGHGVCVCACVRACVRVCVCV